MFPFKSFFFHDLVMYRLLIITINTILKSFFKEEKNWKLSLFFILTNELMTMEDVAVL